MDNRYDSLLRELCEKERGIFLSDRGIRGHKLAQNRTVSGIDYTTAVYIDAVSPLYPEIKHRPPGYTIRISEPEGKIVASTFVPAARHPSKIAGRAFEACLIAAIQEAKYVFEKTNSAGMGAYMIDRFLDNAGNRVDTYGKWAPSAWEININPEVAFLDHAKKSFKAMYGHHMPLHARPDFSDKPSADRMMEILVERWIGSRFAETTPKEGEVPDGYTSFECRLSDEFTTGIASVGSPEALKDYPLRDEECVTVVLGSTKFGGPDYNTSQMFFDDPSKASTWFKAAIASAIFEAQCSTSKEEAIDVLVDLIASETVGDILVKVPEELGHLPTDPSRIEDEFAAWIPVVEEIFNQAYPDLKFDDVCPGFNETAPSFKP